MNLEIKQKYDNFIKIIEKKEKLEWLEQNNSHNKYIPDLLICNEDILIPIDNNNINNFSENNEFIHNNYDIDCECNLSSGYTSSDSKIVDESNKVKLNESNILYESTTSSDSNNFNKSINNYQNENENNKSKKNNYSFNNINKINRNERDIQEMSLLDDNFAFYNKKIPTIIKNDQNSMNYIHSIDLKNSKDCKDSDDSIDSMNSMDSTESKNSINSEFKHLFQIDNKKMLNSIDKEKNDNSSTKNKLEQIYKKVIKKKEKKNNQNQSEINNYDLGKYLDLTLIKSDEIMLKKLSSFVEKYLFEESTRGWNFNSDVYILNIPKLIDNLKKIIFINNYNIKFGFLYRDYSNPKTFLEKDFSKFWIGYEKSSENLDIKKIDYSIKNKLLYYSFKNLSKSSKFKKRIGKYYYKFIKKTIQVSDNKELIIDLIFYFGIKKV